MHTLNKVFSAERRFSVRTWNKWIDLAFLGLFIEDKLNLMATCGLTHSTVTSIYSINAGFPQLYII